MTFAEPSEVKTAPRADGALPSQVIRNLPVLAAASSLLLALLTIGARDFWLDEAFTIGSTNQLLESFDKRSGSMFLYYVFIAPFVDVSIDPTWLRLPSAVFVAVGVGVTVDLAARYFGHRVGLWTAVLIVPMWGATRYAQEVRSYGLVLMLAAVAWWLFFRLAERDTRRGWIGLGVVWAALVYSHPMAGLIPLAQLAAARQAPRPSQSATLFRRTAPAAITFALLCVPMGLSYVMNTTQAAPDWVPGLGQQTLSSVLEMVAGPWGAGQTAVAAGLVSASLLLARHQVRHLESWRLRALLIWLWLPGVVLAAISLGEPMLLGRYLIGSLPAAAIVLALALASIRSSTIRLIAGVGLVLALTPGLVMLHRDAGQPWVEAIQVIANDPTTDDLEHGVIFLSMSSRGPFEVNAARTNVFDRTTPIGPIEPWGDYRRYYPELTLTELQPLIDSMNVIWLAQQHVTAGRGAEEHWHLGVAEPLERVGFCHEVTHTFDYSIEISRFRPCDTDPEWEE